MLEHFKEPLFESIYHQANIAILVSDSNGRLAMANQKAHEIFGYPANEIIGKMVEDLIPRRFHHSHVKDRSVYHEHATSRPMGIGRDLYGLRRDNTEFPVEVSLSPFEINGETWVFSFVIDISVRKKIEASERNYQQKLDEILRSLTKEKELNDLKSRFITMASHEFKTPLSTILSSASLLSKYTESDQQDKRDKHIDRIQSAARTLNGILSDFLSINQLEEGKVSLRFYEFNLKEFLESVLHEFQFLLKKGQKINFEFQGSKIVYCDPEVLRIILNNLLTNASKFSDENSEISLRVIEKKEGWFMNIKDTGIGMSEADLNKVFDRFYRGENAFVVPGTGLGLHIVQNYMDLLRGKIEITSKLGQGTEIILIFDR